MLRGSCLCGAVRYEVTGPVHDVHHCHCGMCRKSHGAAFSTFARLTAADFRVVAGREHVRAHRSSPPRLIANRAAAVQASTPFDTVRLTHAR